MNAKDKKVMNELVKDPKVNTQIGLDRLDEAKTEFAEGPAEDSPAWTKTVKWDKAGRVIKELRFYKIVVKNAPKTKGLFWYDLHSYQIKTTRAFVTEKENIEEGAVLTEDSNLAFRSYLEAFGLINKELIQDAIRAVALEDKRHPIRDLLLKCYEEWDQTPRLDRLMPDYFSTPYNEYVRLATRKIFVAAVARIFKPGTKFDYVFIISGPQGTKKSTFVDTIGMGYTSDTISTVTGKEAYEQLIGIWIGEMAELAALKKASSAEAAKHFISKTDDYFRESYAKTATRHPRQIIFFGTTNDSQMFKDPTGNRRFWPVEVGEEKPAKCVFKDLPNEVRQIWGEAVNFFKKGEPLFLSYEVEEMARQIQKDHMEIDPRVGLIQGFLDRLLPENWESKTGYERAIFWNTKDDDLGEKGKIRRNKVCVAEIWVELFKNTEGSLTPYNARDLYNILKNLEGWELKKSTLKFPIYGYQRTFIRQTKEPILTNEGGESNKRRVNNYEQEPAI